MDQQDALMFETTYNQSTKPEEKLESPRASIYCRLPLRDSSSSNWSSITDENTSHWDLDMHCADVSDTHQYKSLEEVCERTKASLPVSARMGLPATYSGSGISVASSTSTSSFDLALDEEPDVSRSFDSTRSFYPLTLARKVPDPRRQSNTVTTPRITGSDGPHPGLRNKDDKGHDSFGCSPRSGLRSLIYRGNGQSPASPKTAIQRGSPRQSLGLSTAPSRVSSSHPGQFGSMMSSQGFPCATSKEIPSVDNAGAPLDPIRCLSLPSGFGPQQSENLTTRRKLPPLAIRGTYGTTSSMMPQTPGGSMFPGARDGAATGGQTPISPFVPPTPLMAARSQEQLQNATPYLSDKKRGSLPNIYAPSVSHSHMQRQGSLGPMSPLSRDFANVSMRATPPAPPSVSSQDSAWSASTTLTTPPFSPLGVSKSLTTSDLTEEDLALGALNPSVSIDADANARNKKRAKEDCVTSTLHRDESTLGAPRPKLLKSKSSSRTSPYPTNKEAALTASPGARNKLEASPSSLNPTIGRLPSPLLSIPTAASQLAGTSMEKSLSAPPQPASAEPQTVSAKHLSNRLLHPAFAATYSLADELGSGGFGFVVSATRNSDGMPVAVKFIWKDKVPSHGWVRDPVLGVIPLEAFVLRVVDHPCVVKFVELYDDEEFFYLVMEMHGTPWKAPEAECQTPVLSSATSQTEHLRPEGSQDALENPKLAVYTPDSSLPTDAVVVSSSQEASLACSSDTSAKDSDSTAASAKSGLALPPRPAPMERRTSRDLFECIEQHTRFPEDRAAWVFAQIVEAVYFLDKLGICHRDIKDENCVIDSDWNVKLIDFGSAVISDPRKPPPFFNRFFGTMTFASSEILQGQQYRAPHAEVWSLGVLLSILLSGECPFSDPSAAKRGRISSRVRNSWSPEALNLLMGCVQVDPDRRATISQVREHPWVRRAWTARGLERPPTPRIF